MVVLWPKRGSSESVPCRLLCEVGKDRFELLGTRCYAASPPGSTGTAGASTAALQTDHSVTTRMCYLRE